MNIFLVAEKYSPHLYFRQNLSRGGILGRFLRLLLHAIHSHLYQLILLSPMVFLDLLYKISTATAESRWGLGFFSISLCLLLKAALFFSYYSLFLYKYILYQIETIIRNALKGGKPNRKPSHPNGFRNTYKIIN